MSFGGMNPLAIILAAFLAFAWSILFARFTGRATNAVSLLTTALAMLVAAWVLAGSVGHLGPGQVTLRNSLISALFVWAGFSATTLGVSGRHHALPWRAVLLGMAHWLAALLLMGAVIGGIGV